MTILIALNLGELAIIAADKKEVLINNGIIYPLNEEANKVIDTGIGLITGSGYVSLVNRVKSTVLHETITNTDQILSIIFKERRAIQDNNSVSESDKCELLDKTGWLLSYRTTLDDQPKLRLALFHPSISEKSFILIEDNTSKIIFPSDMKEESISNYQKIISSGMKLLSEGGIQDIISHNVNLVLNIIHEISKESKMVSETCDIGLVFNSGEKYMARSVCKKIGQFSFVPIHP